MTPDQFKRVKALYLELESVAPEEQLDRLEKACADDPIVREYVANMLRQTASDDDVLTRVTGQIQRILATGERRLEELLGQRIGAYDIEAILGHGGMGIVYRAKDLRLDRWAALKAVLPNTGDRENYLNRFRREARVLASLSHPNIATVFGLEEAHGTLFLAMELIEGKTLAQRLARGAMSVEASLETCQQVAAGVEAAHEAGIIHRDLKPANIMFTRDDTVKVLDFGLARDIGDTSPRDSLPPSLTRKGSLFGTPAYMSPEQARGETLDERSDVFSFGAVLYKCLTGRSPFSGETNAEVLECVLTDEPDLTLLPPTTPALVRSILNRCLAKRPAERYRHIGDVRLDLLDALKARDWEPRKPRISPRHRILRALPWAAAILMAAAVGTVFFTGGMATHSPGESPAQRFDVMLPNDTPQRDLERLQLALSPDGQSIVVACQTQEGQALWIRSHADGQWRKIEKTEGGHRPAFQPDGQWITFFRGDHVFNQSINGRGDPIRLCNATNWYGASWADDGTMVFTPTWGTGVMKVPPRSGKLEFVTKQNLDQSEFAHLGPHVVSGSRWLLYTVWTGGEICDIHATHMDTGIEHVVVKNGTTPRFVNTPRGGYMLFERSSTIFAMPFDPQTATPRGLESAIAEGVMNDGTRNAAYFDVASDGTLVYFNGTSFAEESRLSYVNADGTTTPFNDDRTSFSEPVFSADGNKLAVAIKGKVYRSMIYELARQTKQMMHTGGDTVAHKPSPDGQQMVCTVNRDGGYGIDLISLVDGRRIRRLVEPGTPDYQSDLDWSNDGKFITFTMSAKEGTPRDVYMLTLDDGSKPRVLVSTAAADMQAAIAPDGKTVAFVSEQSGRREIYTVACPEGDRMRQVSNGGGECPAWSPDGKLLYYISPQGLVSVDITSDGAAASRPRVVYDKPFGQSDPIARNFTIAPDGRPLIVEPSERRPSITHMHVITRWYELLPK